jgi:acetate---CoA ligase (ADP-forming)
MLDEAEAKARCAPGSRCRAGSARRRWPRLVQGGAHLTPPLALKGLGVAHKTEAGAVRLNLATLDGQAEMPGANGYLAEEMVTGVVAEVLLGARRDPVYGATLTLGFGGVTAELLADTVTLVCPVTGRDRGGAAPPAAVAAAGRLPRAAAGGCRRGGRCRAGGAGGCWRRCDAEEIEINPLMVREQGRGRGGCPDLGGGCAMTMPMRPKARSAPGARGRPGGDAGPAQGQCHRPGDQPDHGAGVPRFPR